VGRGEKKFETENGKWKMENGKWKMENDVSTRQASKQHPKFQKESRDNKSSLKCIVKQPGVSSLELFLFEKFERSIVC